MFKRLWGVNGQNIARRLIALVVTFFWSLLITAQLTYSVAYSAGVITSDKYSLISEQLASAAMLVNGSLVIVMGFYFVRRMRPDK